MLAIRAATAEDHTGIIVLEAEIQTQHHEGAPFLFPPTGVISHDDYLVLLQQPDEKIVVAEEDGEIVGYLQYQLIDRPANYYMHAERLLYVMILKVKDTHRRRGIGEALLQRAEELAREFGASRITLEVFAFNASAVKFYERVGFDTFKFLMSKPVTEDHS